MSYSLNIKVISQQLHPELKRDIREQLKEWETSQVEEEKGDDSSDTSDSGESASSDTDTESCDETYKVYRGNNNSVSATV